MRTILVGNEKFIVKKKTYNLYLIILILILSGHMVLSQGKSDDKQRGVSLIVKRTSQSKGRKCALIIGINKYECISALKNPVTDAQAVEGILLNKFGYKSSDVTTLYDKEATFKNIYEKLEEYLGEKGLKEEDTLFVFFSGHGIYDYINTYWLPVDFRTDLKNGENKKESIIKIHMSDIKEFLVKCKAKHIFVAADSCFAGKYISLFERESNSHNYDKKSRQILVSGRELVMDYNALDGKDDGHSPFVKSILEVLENNWTEFTAETLIDQVLKDFRTDFNQHPEGGPLDYVGDEGGQFVFTPEYAPKEFGWAQKVKKILNQKDDLKSETMRKDLLNNCSLFLDKNPRPLDRFHDESYEQLIGLKNKLEKDLKITKKLKDHYNSWIKIHKKEKKIKESKVLLKEFEESPVDEDLASMRKRVENYINKIFKYDYDNLKKAISYLSEFRKVIERLTMNFLNMYRGIKIIESKVEDVEAYFDENLKINPLYFSTGLGLSVISTICNNSSNIKSGNFEIGYHLKIGYLIDSPVLLTPFFLSSYQFGGKVIFELFLRDYPLQFKAEKSNMMGFGINLSIRYFIEKIGNFEMGSAIAYNRYSFNIHEIKNQSNNTTLDFIEINHKKYSETFSFGFVIAYEISSRLYVGMRLMYALKSKSLFKYEININPETKANLTIPANFNYMVSIGIKFYL